jgi:DNA-binding transcriptional MerR regulator
MALYTAGKLGKDVGLTASGIKYYVTVGLITPSERTKNGYMIFRPDDRDRVMRIKELQKQGKTIPEICNLLRVG